MEYKRNKIINITLYIVSIIIYLVAAIVLYRLLLILNYYYLFITIPMLLLFSSLCLTNIIKTILTLVSMIFGRNGNDEVITFIENRIKGTNRLCKYTLIAIFITLLTSIMILDIVYCINKEEYTFVAISICVWILLYYLLFGNIIKMIKREIKL